MDDLEVRQANLRAWWFGINNERLSSQGAHVSNAQIVPFLRDEVATFAWPFGGARMCWKLYDKMAPGDRVVLWRGAGHEPVWGVIGFATISRIVGAGKGRYFHLVRRKGPFRPITPYPSKRPAKTSETDFLWSALGGDFRPLHKVFKKLRYAGEFRTNPITVWPMTPKQHAAILARASVPEKLAPSPGEASPALPSDHTKPTEDAPSAERYVAALAAAVKSDRDKRILEFHYHAPERTVSATTMARALGYQHYSVANSQYGVLVGVFEALLSR